MMLPSHAIAKPISRFVPLIASLMLELSGGSIYIVSLYLHDVEKLWFPGDPQSLEKVESLAFMCNLGNWIPLAGFFYDSRIGGPRRTVLVACLLTLVGYGGLWLLSLHVPEAGYGSGPKFVLLHVLWFLWGHGSGYFDCACITTTAANFPRERGTAIGVAKALYGLSGSLLTQPYMCFFAQPSSAPGFLAFLAVGLSGLGAAVAPLVREAPFSPQMMAADAPRRRLRSATLLIVGLALAMTVAGILHSLGKMGAYGSYVALGVAVAGVLALPTVARGAYVAPDQISLLPKAAEGGGGGGGTTTTTADGAAPPTSCINADGTTATAAATAAPDNDSAGQQSAAPSSSTDESYGDEAAAAGGGAAPASLTNAPVWVTLCTLNFWLIFLTFFAGAGGGIVITNHLEYFVTAQFGPARVADVKRTKDALVSLFSVCNAFGRLGAGMGSDALRRYVDRPLFMLMATVLMGASHAMLLLARYTGFIYAAAVSGGLAYGAFWSLLPALIGELFGMKAFASTYNAYTPALSGASLILSTQLAAKVAESHTASAPPAPPGAPPPPPPPCYGDDCYALTHLVIIGLCAGGVACSAVLWCRVRGFYQGRRGL